LSPRSEGDGEEEEVSDNELGDMTDVPIKKKKNKNRAMAISGESLDPAALKEQIALIPLVPKEPEVAEALNQVVMKTSLLRGLAPDLREVVVQALSGPMIYNAGDIIFNQNDIGDNFYLIQSGSVDVTIKRGNNESALVHNYVAGDGFGELALMYNAPRAATCIASEDTVLWSLSRFAFKVIVVYTTFQKRELYLSFLRTVPVLTSLGEMELLAVADAINEERYSNGEIICKQGDIGETFYIVLDGEAVCSQIDEVNRGAPDIVVAVLSRGHYFGEISLLTKKPRTATVRAPNNGSVTVVSLDRATFKRILGPLDEIMKRNMTQYNKFAAQGI
jgi:cAMP-dependent protein kinase regulator